MAECQNVSDFCVRKRMRLGLGLYGRMSGCLRLLREIKGKIRVRVAWQNVRTSELFLSETGKGWG